MKSDDDAALVGEMLDVLDGRCTIGRMLKVVKLTEAVVMSMAEQLDMDVDEFKVRTSKEMVLCRRCEFNLKADDGSFVCTHLAQYIDLDIYDVETAVDDGCTFGCLKEHYRRNGK